MKPNDKAIEAAVLAIEKYYLSSARKNHTQREAMSVVLTAAYAAQFQSEDYAGLIARRKARGGEMTETKWTPGPHFAEITRSQIPESEDADITYIITDKDKNEIVTFYNESAETFANAQLYAAASDLYAATDLVERFSALEFGNDFHEDSEVPVFLTVGDIRALINARRKARGE